MSRTLVLVGIGAVAVGLLMGYGASEWKSKNFEGRQGRMEGVSRMNDSSDRDGKKMMREGKDSQSMGKREGMGMRDSNGTGNGSRNGMGMGNRENCLSDECLTVENLNYPVGTLSEDAVEALERAIDDEYKALATYDVFVSKLGSVRPFSMIRRAEEQHISSLKALFDKYGLDIPVNMWVGKVSAPANLQVACQGGVVAEKANVDLYENTLLPAVKSYPDITRVFQNLMDASKNRHLPAFERCD